MKKSLMSIVASAGLICSVSSQQADIINSAFPKEKRIVINEFVVDPKQDRNMDGLITGSDEFFELKNVFDEDVRIDYWQLWLIDTTPEVITLMGVIQEGGYFSIRNPKGEQNNSGELRLVNDLGEIVDSVSFGNWPRATVTNGNSTAVFNESRSRYPEGSTNWISTYATLGNPNRPAPEPALSIARGTNNNTRVYTSAAVSTTSVLQQSADLRNWINVSTNNVNTNLDFKIEEAEARRPQIFYRLQEK